MPHASALRRFFFGIAPGATDCDRRGFQVTDVEKRQRIETIGRTFVAGYHAALADTRVDRLASALELVDGPLRGFAFEGAAMGLALLDLITPWKRDRLSALLDGPGNAHAYMVHVGAGWAAARIPWARARPERLRQDHDPLLCWLAVDGYGFHEGYFSPRRTVVEQRVPPRLRPEARRAFDQGLGRALWFAEGMDAARAARRIGRFPASRQGDLWSGLGLAVAYAGGADRRAIGGLVEAAGSHWPALAQGAAFAAKARQRAGNLVDHTEWACRTMCRISAEQAAAVTDDRLEALATQRTAPSAYQQWRADVQAVFAATMNDRAPVEQLES